MLYHPIKRIIDIIIALILLILSLIVVIPIILVLKFTGEGEVFYFQERIGFQNKRFKIWKFSTMQKDSPNLGTGDITLRNDPRITPLGKYLRFTKLNELPQIINVLLGEMSLVGPRPLMPVSFKMYLPEHADKVYESKPGITGIGSIIFRDEEKMASNATSKGFNPRDFYKNHIYPYKGEVEMWYLENKSLFIDLAILFLTAWAIFFPHSNLTFKIFKDLPEKPEELVV